MKTRLLLPGLLVAVLTAVCHSEAIRVYGPLTPTVAFTTSTAVSVTGCIQTNASGSVFKANCSGSNVVVSGAGALQVTATNGLSVTNSAAVAGTFSDTGAGGLSVTYGISGGSLTVSGSSYLSGLTVSTNTTTSDNIQILGAVQALPTATYNAGVFAKFNGKVYISTMSPVTAAGDWKPLW